MTDASHVHPVPEALAQASTWVLSLVLVVVPVALYLLGVALRRRRLTRGWPAWRTVSWSLGMLLVAAAVSPPLAAFAHADARGHMAQHLLLGMYAPLALVLAAPVTLLLGASSTGVRRDIARLLRTAPVHGLAHPVTAGLLNVGGLYLLYLTGTYALSLREPAVHVLVNVHFVTAGVLFSWAVVGPDPARRRPGVAVRLSVLVISAAAHAYVAKLLYARAPALPPGSGHTVDQLQQAAQWMYYGGDVAEILLAVALFAGWYRQPVRTAVQPGGASMVR